MSTFDSMANGDFQIKNICQKGQWHKGKGQRAFLFLWQPSRMKPCTWYAVVPSQPAQQYSWPRGTCSRDVNSGKIKIWAKWAPCVVLLSLWIWETFKANVQRQTEDWLTFESISIHLWAFSFLAGITVVFPHGAFFPPVFQFGPLFWGMHIGNGASTWTASTAPHHQDFPSARPMALAWEGIVPTGNMVDDSSPFFFFPTHWCDLV